MCWYPLSQAGLAPPHNEREEWSVKGPVGSGEKRLHTASCLSLPVRWAKVAVEPHPVGNALDQPAGTAAPGIPLVAVHQLVGEDAGNLGCET